MSVVSTRHPLLPAAAGFAFACAMTALNAALLLWMNPPVEAPEKAPRESKSVPMALSPVTPELKRPPPPPIVSDVMLQPLQPLQSAAVTPPAASLSPALPALKGVLGGLSLGLTLGHGGDLGLEGGAVPTADAQAKATQPARPLRRPAPKYPKSAARRGVEGEVVVRVRIDPAGRVVDAKVVRATPPGIFDAAALAAARRYRFAPATNGGAAVASTLEQRILFRVPK